jgi:hypothetical protein
MKKPKKEVPAVTEVTVADGVVNPSKPKIPNQGILVMTNEDLDFYRVQLCVPSDKDHPPMYGVLPPLGALVLMAGPEPGDQDTHCKFEIFVTDMLNPKKRKRGAAAGSGGGHTIKIGS